MGMNIAVIAGGTSTERDVSLSSGKLICASLRRNGHNANMIDVFLGSDKYDNVQDFFNDKNDLEELASELGKMSPKIKEIETERKEKSEGFFGPMVLDVCKAVDIVYIGLHGSNGEDGKIQAAFDLFGIKYTGTDYLSSAISMDKHLTKKMLATEGVPVPKGITLKKGHKLEYVPFPCVVKPCCGGSSVGMSIAKNEEEYNKALELAFKYEDEVVVEEYIKGREFSVGVIGGKSLPIIEIIPKSGVYDYETKYQPGMAEDVCPAPLSDEITDKMQTYAIDVYRELKLGSYARIDFLLDADDNMYCLEANTLPGMTATSLLPQEAKVLGIEYGVLCEQVIAQALATYNGETEELPAPGTNSHYGKDDLKSL